MIREIVTIDEDLCNGCGQCVPACAEGAIQVIQGKARLVSDNLCDGLGACLGHCPLGAIKVERRDADAFDEEAVRRHTGPPQAALSADERALGAAGNRPGSVPSIPSRHTGCPSARLLKLEPPSPADEARPNGKVGSQTRERSSQLTHWPVQLRLVPPTAPFLRGARLLVAADCVPVACPDFHRDLLQDHVIVIACPKLDDPEGYIEKLPEMIRSSGLAEITVAHMEVPCCTGILQAVLTAWRCAGRDVPVNDVVVGIRGQIIARRRISAEPMVA